MDLQSLNSIAGLLSFGFMILGGYFVVRSKTNKNTNDAQQNAISALQAEVTALRGRIIDAEKETLRAQLTIQTICAALKTRGLVITIQGEMVNITDDKGSSVTTPIRTTI